MRPKKNVWVNGTFDVLHMGHIKLLERASFEASSIDNKKDMVDISVPICIILANVTDFIEEERIKIMKAEVQTALFKKEI